MKDARDTSPTSLTRVILRTTSRRLRKATSWTFAWEDQTRDFNRQRQGDWSQRSQGSTPRREHRFPRPRHHLDASADQESMVEPRGEMPRRAETSEYGVPFRSVEASPSEPPQASAAAASDTPTGERLFVSMTEEGLSGDYRMTMQRDRHGRWILAKEETIMTNEEAIKPRRDFYVGESKEDGTPSVASAEAIPLHREFLSQSSHTFRKQSKPNGKECSTSRR